MSGKLSNLNVLERQDAQVGRDMEPSTSSSASPSPETGSRPQALSITQRLSQIKISKRAKLWGKIGISIALFAVCFCLAR